ncbi:MAG: aromatic ring-hydroxylating dioxygenase subunit alpha [Ignavibacteria bacterium]|nr:MAG: aromatic ring-hydroxylating dioxygenase subunit alpha [Ignavibacteria bacterium]
MTGGFALPPIAERDLTIDPLERSETIPSAWYTDPRFFEIDKQSIFAKTWQLIGHSGRLQKPGDFLIGTVAGNPVILVHGKDGSIRGFYNVCRHRGGPISIEEGGNCNALQCKYHGWTYTLEGMLRGVPQFDRVELFDRKDYGLIPVPLDSWEGLYFVNLSGERSDDRGDLRTLLGGISERIRPVEPGAKHFYKRINYELNCNWKVYVDNYLEGYHLPYVHPELCNLLDYQSYVTETFGYYSLQHSPLTGKSIYGSMKHPTGSSPTQSEPSGPSATGSSTGDPSSGTSDDGQAFYYFIFPNIMLNILPGRLQTNVVVPLAHDRTKVIFDYYYDDVDSPLARRSIEEDISYSDRIQLEDAEICEHVQRGLESVAYDRGRFSVEMEKGVYHFQCLLKDAYGRALAASKDSSPTKVR